ncbi:putative cytochrome P450 6a14 [Pseudolycoriella hygida]|uniref:Cytochrome P450 6a14 n=1 Tax=Pseudolycoriella hygida TaxID=35572 RepID=A0A9Q0RUI2_9DIPT|nr:putative cytochrome P450 6a14 [Pseudolycoriella hygida]
MVLFTLLLSMILVTVSYFYISYKIRYQFWKKRNVPYLQPIFPIGNMLDSFKQKHFAYTSQEFYNQLKHHGDYAGVFFFKKPVLIVLTPEFAKTVLVKDFQYFVDRGVYFNKKDDPLSANLFFIEGDEWRHLRNKISPAFTSGKIKVMFRTMLDIADNLVGHFCNLSSNLDQSIEIREYLARYTTDVIGSIGFGLECNSITDPNSEFRRMGKKMFNFSQLKNFKIFLGMLMRKQARALRMVFNDDETTNFVLQIVQETIKHRRQNNIKRNDFMQLMINLYQEETEEVTEHSLTLEEIAAQSFVFFFAGFETSSTTMTYALHELAVNPDIQDKLRNEINDGFDKNGGELTYDSVMAMTYLDQVINETLRKYPPVASLHRMVTKDYKLPNGSIITQGNFLFIPTYAFHHDPENFPNPNRFDPNRFSDENKAGRHPFAYLPFGEGPRICVGLRFGLIQTKVGLAMLLRHFKFGICNKTNVTLKIDNIHMLYVPLGEVWLNMERIT